MRTQEVEGERWLRLGQFFQKGIEDQKGCKVFRFDLRIAQNMRLPNIEIVLIYAARILHRCLFATRVSKFPIAIPFAQSIPITKNALEPDQHFVDLILRIIRDRVSHTEWG